MKFDLRRRATGSPLKDLLIIASLAGGWSAVEDRIGAVDVGPALVAYGLLFLVLSMALLSAARIGNVLIRVLIAAILSVSSIMLSATETVTGEPLTYDGFINLLNSIVFAGDAWQQHGTNIVWAFGPGILLFLGLSLPPSPSSGIPQPAYIAAPLVALGALVGLLAVRGGEGATGLPAAFVPLAYSSLYTYEMAMSSVGPRRDVSIAPPRHRRRHDIVLIVDESVTGDYLDINSAGGVRSGLSGSLPGVSIANFGVAASITNCSIGTNLTLRHGGTRADYRRINATMPAIWRYAKIAGMRTVYIDAQRTGGGLHNLMSGDERRQIDRLVQFDGVPVVDRDMAVADKIISATRNSTSEFILVNKVGAHFPVHDKYPDAYMWYRPALRRGASQDIADTGSRAGFGGSSNDWLRYRNSYRNSVLWSVGAFFDRLLSRADLRNATIIYTSDHGQDLHEGGSAGYDTHCSADPVAQEGRVPLVVIEHSGRGRYWTMGLQANRHRASHYQVFPTLLALMGYDQGTVRATYGPGLAEVASDPATFNALFNARLGREPRWIAIR